MSGRPALYCRRCKHRVLRKDGGLCKRRDCGIKVYKIGSLCEECERYELVQYWKGANLSCPNCGIDYNWDGVER